MIKLVIYCDLSEETFFAIIHRAETTENTQVKMIIGPQNHTNIKK